MSGGHFDYQQYQIGQIADSIDQLIINNNIKDEYNYSNDFSKEALDKFKEGADLCRQAQVFAQRIDWLVSGDDGEDTFHKRLKEDLEKLKENNDQTAS